MNFKHRAANGTTAVVCGNALAGTNRLQRGHPCRGSELAGTEHGERVRRAQIGINGNNVSNLTMTSVSVTGAGNGNLGHGVQFVNLSGTGSITNSTFSNNFHRQFTVQNSTGTLSLNVTGSTFSGNALQTGAPGTVGGAAMARPTSPPTFSRPRSRTTPPAGYFSDGADQAVLEQSRWRTAP